MPGTIVGEQVTGQTVYGNLSGSKVVMGEFPKGLKVWLDPTDNSTLTLSGSDVTTWRSKSTNQQSLAATGTPAVITPGGSMNGLQHIDIVANEYLQYSTNLANQASGEVWFACDNDNTNTSKCMYVQQNSSFAYVTFYPNGAVAGRADAGSQFGGGIGTNSTFAIDVPHVYRWSQPGSGCIVNVDGANQAFTGTFTDWFASYSIANAYLGAYPEYGQNWDGQLGEVFIFDGYVITTDEARGFNIYMNVKWRGVHP